MKNLCSGGLFVATARLLAVGDWVVVSVTIPGAGHLSILDAPEAFAAALADFL